MSERHESDVGSWFLSGKNRSAYEADGGHLKSKRPNTSEFATIAQQHATATAPAAAWLGKRLRFRAEVKTAEVRGWAGLWMRIDGAPVPDRRTPMLGFDNMQDRPLVGTLDWAPCDVVLDVPAHATVVAFGLILSGDGEAWIRAATLEPVGDVPATTLTHPAKSIERGILEANLDPFLLALGWIIGRDIPPDERAAIRAGVLASEFESDRWHVHELQAEPTLRLAVARDTKHCGIRLRLDVGAWQRAEAMIALMLCGRFVLVESMLAEPD